MWVFVLASLRLTSLHSDKSPNPSGPLIWESLVYTCCRHLRKLRDTLTVASPALRKLCEIFVQIGFVVFVLLNHASKPVFCPPG